MDRGIDRYRGRGVYHLGTALIIKAAKTAYDDGRHKALFEKLNSAVGVDTLKGLVQRGSITLFEVSADGKLLGIFLAKSDYLVTGSRELVILHAASIDKPAVPMTRILDKIFRKVAIDHGMTSIRVHSDKDGLNRILTKHNFVYQESIYRKALDVNVIK